MMEFIQQLRWRPGIGDPTLMGWITVLAYGLGAILAWLAARRAGRAPGLARGSRGMWLVVAAVMTFLCLNKQLDLQSLFTDIGRVFAWKQGWYKERREYQKLFVLAVLAASFLLTAFALARYHRFWRGHLLLGFGLAFLLTFIVVRAISFHHVDALLRTRISGVKMNWFFELGGISLISLAALRDWRNPKPPPKPPWKPASG